MLPSLTSLSLHSNNDAVPTDGIVRDSDGKVKSITKNPDLVQFILAHETSETVPEMYRDWYIKEKARRAREAEQARLRRQRAREDPVPPPAPPPAPKPAPKPVPKPAPVPASVPSPAGPSTPEPDTPEDVEDLVQPTVTVAEAWRAFDRHFQKYKSPAARQELANEIMSWTDEQMQSNFPFLQKGSDDETLFLADDVPGPIKFVVWRNLRNPLEPGELKGQFAASPACKVVADTRENFVFWDSSSTSLFAGAGNFQIEWKGRQTVPAKMRSPRNPPVFFDDQNYAPAGFKSKGNRYFYSLPATVLNNKVAEPGKPLRAATTAEECKIEKLIENWVFVLAWTRAAKNANDDLNAPFKDDDQYLDYAELAQVGPMDKEVGILGYDTPMEVPAWAQKLFPKRSAWSNPGFPSLLESGLIRFGRSGQFCVIANKVLEYVKKMAPEEFAKLYPNELIFEHQVDSFLKANGTTSGIAGWERHARIVFKTTQNGTGKPLLKIFDPWKQAVPIPSWVSSAAAKNGYEVVFEPRLKDQGNEGSCVLQSTMRALMASQLGEGGIKLEFRNLGVSGIAKVAIYPVVTQLLYNKFSGQNQALKREQKERKARIAKARQHLKAKKAAGPDALAPEDEASVAELLSELSPRGKESSEGDNSLYGAF